MKADQQYMEWYSEMVRYSPSVVYVLRADQRDFTVDEKAINQLFPTKDTRDKIVIALNFADKLGSIGDECEILSDQEEALERKIELVSSLFSVETYRIFPCSARSGYGVKDLLEDVIDDLSLCVYNPE